jgi:hypothetical protein
MLHIRSVHGEVNFHLSPCRQPSGHPLIPHSSPSSRLHRRYAQVSTTWQTRKLTSQARELEWLLVQLRETLQSLKAGLEECATLLAPTENGSTLVLSSVRSESLKGVVTRVGTRIVKGNVKLRLSSLPPPRGSSSYHLTVSSAPHAPTLVVPQLTAVRTSINTCLDVIDVTTWTGDSTDANFVAGQLRLLYDHIQEARHALKGSSDAQPQWWEHALEDKVATSYLKTQLWLITYPPDL